MGRGLEAAAPHRIEELERRYAELKASLEAIEVRDRDALAALRARFSQIPYREALAEPEARERALAAMEELSAEIEALEPEAEPMSAVSE